MNDFGDFLYALRKEKGMTQAQLADLLGVTNKAVSKWETGEAMPETSLLLPLSRVLGV
ncbi:MAG: helix-turn-helix domain-containing protein, partial [Clostridia bacterium]|nr:helix-turn-helix domain-containing protein [Clostridia bacterium]